MPGKKLYYPDGFQQDVDALMDILESQGVDLRNEKLKVRSESKLFRWLVEQELNRIKEQKRG